MAERPDCASLPCDLLLVKPLQQVVFPCCDCWDLLQRVCSSLNLSCQDLLVFLRDPETGLVLGSSSIGSGTALHRPPFRPSEIDLHLIPPRGGTGEDVKILRSEAAASLEGLTAVCTNARREPRVVWMARRANSSSEPITKNQDVRNIATLPLSNSYELREAAVISRSIPSGRTLEHELRPPERLLRFDYFTMARVLWS